MKTWKHCTYIGVLAFFVLFLAFGCSGGNRLSGTWECERLEEPRSTIHFSGKNFTLTEYPILYKNPYGANFGNHSNLFIKNHDYSRFRFDLLDYLDIIERMGTQGETEMSRFRDVKTGTYSISDGKIELIFSDGSIDIHSFSRTENTISIEQERFTRKK